MFKGTIVSGNIPETYESLLTGAAGFVEANLPAGVFFSGLSLVVSPTLFYSIDQERTGMVSLTQQFEFSAAHRLHCDEFTDEENRAIFGKCNNPEGHGHNYIVELTVDRELESTQGQVIDLPEMESVVKRLIIDRTRPQTPESRCGRI